MQPGIRLMQGEQAIIGGATFVDAEFFFCGVHQIVCTQQRARHCSAYVDEIFADRFKFEHLVERSGTEHFSWRDPDEFCDMTHRFICDPSILFLCDVQQRDECRFAAEAINDFLGKGDIFVSKSGHRIVL